MARAGLELSFASVVSRTMALLVDLGHLWARRDGPDHRSGEKRAKTLLRVQSKEAHGRLVRSSSPEDVFIYTDGSAIGNPGPAGAGTFISFDRDPENAEDMLSGTIVGLYQSLGHGTNNEGEVWGIGAGIEWATEHLEMGRDDRRIYILGDSKLALCQLATGRTSKIRWSGLLRPRLVLLRDSRPDLHISAHWVAGHAKIAGNEIADRLANVGSASSRAKPGGDLPVPFSWQVADDAFWRRLRRQLPDGN